MNRPAPTLTQIVQAAEDFKPDLIGHTVLSPTFESSRQIFAALSAALPKAVLVAGGPHPTALPEHTLTDTKASMAVMGEGENTFRELLAALESGASLEGMPGLAYRDGDRVVIGPQRAFEEDINKFPMPAWDLLRPNSYPSAPPQALQLRTPAVQILTSRGCPYACSYCASFRTMSRSFRPRDMDEVMEEIKYLQREHGVREVMLLDLNFTYDREHALKFCEAIHRHQIDISWKPLAGFRIDAVDDELLRELKRAGCYQLIFGVESFHPDTLAQINKNLDAAIIHEQIRAVKKHGFFVASFFIIGSPGETADKVRYTIREATRSALDFAAFFCWTPMPGAADWSHLGSKIDLTTFHWGNLNYDQADYSDTIPNPELKKLVREGHLTFYSRPRRWLKMLRLIRPGSLRYFLEFAWDYLTGQRGRPRLKA
jgi:anaerobic magnesium-protoporphyrin IX monomethyl ester cyclase